MNLRQNILKENSRKQAEKIAEWVLKDVKRLPELLQMLEDEDKTVVQRAAYPLGILGEIRPHLFIKWIPKIIRLLQNPRHNSVARNLYRVLSFLKIPEKHQTALLDQALADLANPKSPVAVQVFSMTVAANIADPFPEIREEVKDVIEMGMENGSAGYKSRGKKILKKWK